MSIKSKIVLILSAFIVCYAGLNYAIQHMVIEPSFVNLEKDEATKDIRRCVQAIQREIEHLTALAHDWAAWDDTYAFVDDRNEEYIKANLVEETFTDTPLNLIFVVNTAGQVVWGQTYDLENEEIIQVADFPVSETWSPDHPLLAFEFDQVPLEEVSIEGVIHTEGGPMLVASQPIITSENTGPVKGAFIMGVFLNEDVVEMLAEQTEVDFRLWPIQKAGIGPDDRKILDEITEENPYPVREQGADMLKVFASFRDIQGNTALLMQANIAKDITARGSAAVRFAVISIVAAGAFVLVALLVLIGQVIVGPVTRLTKHVISVGETNDLTARISMQRSDEIGRLGEEFDRMVEQLADARKKLVEQSYYSGQAQMAADVLHNVRNSLNPVVERIDVMREHLSQVSMEKLEKAVAELSDDSTPDDRREALNRYVQLTATNLIPVLQESTDDLNVVAEAVGHIESVMAAQDRLSHAEGAIELFKLDEVVYDAVSMLAEEARKGVSVEIDPEIKQLDPVNGERTLLKQVVVNLVENAIDSIRRTAASAGRVEIRTGVENTKGVDMIHMQVRDNGGGIAADDLRRVFERGFTTKEEGHTGLGLHWCANTIAAMNGKISAESEGIGQGACIHLTFPVNS